MVLPYSYFPQCSSVDLIFFSSHKSCFISICSNFEWTALFFLISSFLFSYFLLFFTIILSFICIGVQQDRNFSPLAALNVSKLWFVFRTGFSFLQIVHSFSILLMKMLADLPSYIRGTDGQQGYSFMEFIVINWEYYACETQHWNPSNFYFGFVDPAISTSRSQFWHIDISVLFFRQIIKCCLQVSQLIDEIGNQYRIAGDINELDFLVNEQYLSVPNHAG